MKKELDVFRPLNRGWPFDRFFEDFFPAQGQSINQESRRFLPVCDVEESKNHYLIHVDLPGVKKDDITLEISEGYLTISGEKKFHEERKENDFHLTERSYGSFSRSFRVGNDLDLDAVEARHDNGVLEIRVPKAPEKKARSIKIG